MSASLVGSEMCIRDSSPLSPPPLRPGTPPFQRPHRLGGPQARLSPAAVSYTHLTLPTICSV
eukprot:187953-Alexandrium_andersonii.AAC.1